ALLVCSPVAGGAQGASAVAAAPLSLRASVSERMLYVSRGDSVIRMYDVAVGTDEYPTPRGAFRIRKIVWNPSWRPPNSKWAKDKKAKAPGDPENPMKVVKIFFKEPDYYVHGTGAEESLGSAASHGCLRMASDEVAELAKMIMEHGGEPREENWFMRLLHSRRDEKVVYLKNPIAIEVTG
ncbi:MAG TPA: L,D-transpeptidase, partial [Gemmatimonadaceae bacterium]|nr:L,D-transpeptidase [Gemmatimonadaceae bacterium]